LVVDGTLHDLVHLADLLISISNEVGLLLEKRLKSLPGAATVTRPVDAAVTGLQENDFVVSSAPEQVLYFAIQLEGLEVDG
jgi:replicative DNA helicase